MELHYSNRNSFSKPLHEVLEKFYPAEEIWGILCGIILPAKGHKPPERRPKKVIMVEQLLETFAYDDTMQAFFKSMPANLRAAIEELVWSGDCWLDKFEETLGFSVAERRTVKPKYHYDRERTEVFRTPGFWFIIFDLGDAYYNHTDRITVHLPPALRSLFRQHMPKPRGYNLEPLDAPPEGVQIYRCDDTLAEDLRIVADYIARGHLQFTKSEAIKKPCIRAIEKLTGGSEFFPGDKSSTKLPLVRHELFVNIVASTGATLRNAMLQDPLDPEALLRPLVDTLFQHPDWLHEYVLTHISGGDAYHGKEAAGRLREIFSALSADHWISAGNLESYVNYREIDIDPVPHSRCYVSTERAANDDYSNSRVEIDHSTGWELLAVPLLQGTAFMLAALGLAEIAHTAPPLHEHYRRKGETFLTPYDGFIGIRLTPLGAYAFGHVDEVELKAEDRERAEIILNPSRLTATCRNIDPVTELSLLDYMEKVSEGCYRLTRQSLMRGCTSASDVRKRTNEFKRHIVADPPPFWNDFLEETATTAVALRKNSGYVLYELADSPQLRHLLVSDPVLRGKILKVEGMKTAIAKADLPAVVRRLAALGHLIQ